MKKTLFLVMLLLSFSVYAEKIRVFDDVCVAEQIRNCLIEHTGCATGTNITTEKMSGNQGAVCGPVPSDPQSTNKFQMIVLSCEIAGRSTRALSANCGREIDIPSAAQIKDLTNAFNDNFVKALEKAFPQPAAPSQPTAPSVQTQ